MTSLKDGPLRVRRRGYDPGDGCGRGRGPGLRSGGKHETTLAARTAMRAMIAAGTYVAQDVRDRDGLTRPMLRRAALRMAVCRQEPLRRIGAAYLRTDSPAFDQLPAEATAPLPASVRPPVSAAAADEVIDVDPSTVSEADGPEIGQDV